MSTSPLRFDLSPICVSCEFDADSLRIPIKKLHLRDTIRGVKRPELRRRGLPKGVERITQTTIQDAKEIVRVFEEQLIYRTENRQIRHLIGFNHQLQLVSEKYIYASSCMMDKTSALLVFDYSLRTVQHMSLPAKVLTVASDNKHVFASTADSTLLVIRTSDWSVI